MSATPGGLHRDRAWAESFGSTAQRYDTYRPAYPEALIDDLAAERPANVLDVGCGTGKAAVALAPEVAQVCRPSRLRLPSRRHVANGARLTWSALEAVSLRHDTEQNSRPQWYRGQRARLRLLGDRWSVVER